MKTIGIDASRNRSGGTIAHLLGILKSFNPSEHGVKEVHVWSYDALHNRLPTEPWLIKHRPHELNGSLLTQIFWQYLKLPKELRKAGCDVLLSTDAGTVCNFKPDIVMSRDMLSFEGAEMLRYPLFSFSRIRLLLLKWLQVRSLRNASGGLFLTNYAANVIQTFTGSLKSVRIIPHGVGENFRTRSNKNLMQRSNIKLTYVSNADLYKHQWNVIEAISMLRNKSYSVELDLIGAGSGPYADKVLRAADAVDLERTFINITPIQEHDKIAQHLFNSDIFIFASSCENMPNTLIEAMAAGLPIACSDRGPMPEVLGNGGVYFDPEDVQSIFYALKLIIDDKALQNYTSDLALERSKLFSWERCATETFKYLIDIAS